MVSPQEGHDGTPPVTSTPHFGQITSVSLVGNRESLLRLTQHQTTCNHIVQRLLFLRESGHDVTDIQRNQASDDLREKPPGGARKTYGPPFHVGHHQSQRHFTKRSLVAGTLHSSEVEPRCD